MSWNREMLKGDFSFANSWFKDEEKIFCIGLWLEMRSGYSTTIPRRKNTTLSPVNRCHRPQHQYYGHSRFEDHTLYLVGPKGSCLLWAAETWRFHYGRSVSATIDLFEPLREKWPEYKQRHDKVILLHDNARPHVAKAVKKYLETLKWNVLPHPPYSPDILITGCSEYNKSLVHFFRKNRKLAPKNWIASKDESFFRDGIRKLPERWEKVGSDSVDNTLIDLFIHFVLK